MTTDEVIERVAKIAASSDDEEQHVWEDALRNAVLKAIAAGAENARELATEALKTNDMDFFRWYA